MIKLKSILIIYLSIWITTAFAEYKYDYRTGNSYNTYNSGDRTTVQGYNDSTGSSWNTTIDSSGNMNGTDSSGNNWNYNSSSKTYINYGTGKMCTGSGATRTCY